MNNTVKTIVISLDSEQMRREIYAESACVALMEGEERPPIITDDNRKLVNVLIDNAFVEFVSEFLAFIDSDDYHAPGNGVVEIPLLVPVDTRTPAPTLRRLVEKMIADAVLESCYESRDIADVFRARRVANASLLRTILAPKALRFGHPLF